MIVVKLTFTQGRGFALLSLFLINMMIINLNFSPSLTTQDELAVNQGSEAIGNSPEEVSLPSSADFEEIDSWWNESYRYRIEVQITELGITSRTNEPVTIWSWFDYGTHSLNSTRVVKYDAGLGSYPWDEIPCQIWNTSISGDFLTSCTITFMVSIAQSQISKYFVYYTDNFVENKTAIYQAETEFVTGFYGDSVVVDNGQIEVQLANQTAYNSLKIKGKARNYHADSSLAPSSALPTNELSALYTPNMTSGYIMDWLICGPFIEDNYSYWPRFQTNLFINDNTPRVPNTPGWADTSAISGPWRNFVDVNKSYVEGDYASGATVNATFIGQIYSKQWVYKQFSDASGLINLNTYLSPNERRSAYALTYVYSPISQNVYVKASSDDALRVYVDGTLVYDASGYLRGAGSSDQNDRDVINNQITLKAGWTRILVMCGENTGDWGFRLRFCTENNLHGALESTNVITNFKIGLAPISFIDAQSPNNVIEEEMNGPVFAQYSYQWADSEDMKAWDNVTFYQSMNMFKVERKFWFYDWRTTNPRNNSFAALNTFYSGSYFDEYIYDGQTMATGLSNTGFQASNYTIIRDRSGDNYLTSLGVFITQLSKGYSGFTFSSLRWKVTYKDGIVNFLPGNWTDLDNLNSWLYQEENYDRYVTVTFWEYLDESVGTANTDATVIIDSVYQGLMNPLNVEVYRNQNESLFFNFDVQVRDVDGNYPANVNVTLVNATDGTGWDTTWNQVANQSQLTDANGVAHFVRMTQGNYTVNLTYAAYGHAVVPISQYEWGQGNVTLNTSQLVYYTNIPLTKLILTFRQFDSEITQYKGMIVGGNVTFYTNRSSSLEKIGSLNTDVNGRVEFYWRSYAESEANTTFEIDFLGGIKKISYNESIIANDFQDNITLPMTLINSHSIGVKIGDFSTRLMILSTSLDNTMSYGEMLTVTVNYSYTVIEEGNKPISGASVIYRLSSSARGIFNISSFEEIGNGVYNFTFASNASWLDLHSGISYTMSITATKDGFTPNANSTTIVLKNITTQVLAIQNSFQIYWNENFTASFEYRDTFYGKTIEGATLRYQVATRPDIQGDLVEVSPGQYNFTLNSTTFTYASTYILTITASRDNYHTNTTIIDLRIQEIKTYIGSWLAPSRQSIAVQEVLNVNVTTSYTMYLNYTTETGEGIASAAVKEYDWEDPLGNKHTEYLTDEGNGIYTIPFNTTNKPLGKYFLYVTVGQTNYVRRWALITLYIVEKPIVVTLVGYTQGGIVKRPQGEDITLSVYLHDPVADGPLVGAIVVLTFDGQDRPMSPASTTGYYTITLPTSTYNALFAQIDFPSKIRVTMANYTQVGGDYLFTISIAPPELFGIPQIYWIIIGSTVGIVVVAFAIMKGVQRSRIPQFVRHLDNTSNLIRKNKPIGRENIAETRGESIGKALDGRFASIGMSATEKFAPKPTTDTGKAEGERNPEKEVA